MNVASLIFALALFLIVATFIMLPIIRPTATTNDFDTEAYLLEARRVRILAAIADLDFEHSTGKIDQEVYDSERTRLVANGVEALKQLDAAGLTEPAIANEPDTSIEESAAQTRTAKPLSACSNFSCPECLAATGAADRFCAKCGCALDYFLDAT